MRIFVTYANGFLWREAEPIHSTHKGTGALMAWGQHASQLRHVPTAYEFTDFAPTPLSGFVQHVGQHGPATAVCGFAANVAVRLPPTLNFCSTYQACASWLL